MKRTTEPREMTLAELKKALPVEEARAARLREFTEARPDLGFGWEIAASNAKANVREIVELIKEKEG